MLEVAGEVVEAFVGVGLERDRVFGGSPRPPVVVEKTSCTASRPSGWRSTR
jgi:hypothetical protein